MCLALLCLALLCLALLCALPVPVLYCDPQVVALCLGNRRVADAEREPREEAPSLSGGEPGEGLGVALGEGAGQEVAHLFRCRVC